MGYQPARYTIEECCPKRYYIKDNNYFGISTGPFSSLWAARRELKKKIKREKNYPKIIERYDSDGNRV